MNEMHCDICGVTPPTPFLRMQNWVKPCPCGWTHRQCINLAIMKLQAIYPGKVILCGHCHTAFRVEPPSPYLATVLCNFNKRWRTVNRVVAVMIVIIVYEAVAVTSGMISLVFIWGKEEVKTAITKNPCFISNISLLICESAIIICSIPWEDAVMSVLRRGSSLPMIGELLPKEDPDVKVSPIRKYPLMEGLLLPFIAKLTGDYFFADQHSKMRRYIIGGVTFLLIKGFLVMFYKQKVYSRKRCLEIGNYETENI